MRAADDKIYVRPQELIHLSYLKVKFGTGGLIHPGVLSVFNHADNGEPNFGIGKPWIYTTTNRTTRPKSFRKCLVDHHNLHRVKIVVLWCKGATLQQPNLHCLEVIVTNDVPIVDVLRRAIGCLLVAFYLGVVSINSA